MLKSIILTIQNTIGSQRAYFTGVMANILQNFLLKLFMMKPLYLEECEYLSSAHLSGRRNQK
ncbi:hypothetical protein [Helicobacter fennelliae]|uniref:hypothetical protein n=1 Tax=Helicobacter fennelliae TaxID=215 RepID=UPI0015ECA931|nr:hypothetical protein [Helicobacter fennelliae]